MIREIVVTIILLGMAALIGSGIWIGELLDALKDKDHQIRHQTYKYETERELNKYLTENCKL